MGNYVEIREPMISADKVYDRWPGMHGHEYELASLIDSSGDPFAADGIPAAYCVHKVLDAGSGVIISECSECKPGKGEKYSPPYRTHYQGNDVLYDFTGIAFKLAEIIEYEKDKPKLFFKVVANPDEAWNTGQPVIGDEEIQVDKLRKALMMSPQGFVDFLNCRTMDNRLITSWEESFREASIHSPYFTREDIQNENLTVHTLDWESFQQQEKERQGAVADVPFEKDKPTPLAELKAQLAEAQTQNESLRQWNKRLNEQNQELRIELAELKAQPATAEPTTTVTAAKWEDSVTAAFGVWGAIIAGDKTDWKEDEFRAALAERCSDYHTKVHSTAWRLLPDAFKHGRGRPKKNPDKSQQSDNS